MGDTAFLMEPDVKSGKGGLRDVSTIFWLSMAWYGVPTARELIGQGSCRRSGIQRLCAWA